MDTEYRHTQYGALMFVVFLLTGVLIAVVAVAIIGEGRMLAAIIMICVYLLGLGMFYASTIEISEGQVKFWFGIGIVRKTIALSDIQSSMEVDIPWYYFWGVKSIPGGWYWSIAPGTGVEIVLKNGSIVLMGTNQPKELKQAIDEARQQPV